MRRSVNPANPELLEFRLVRELGAAHQGNSIELTYAKNSEDKAGSSSTMKVLSLRCIQRHSFESWFGSEDNFESEFSCSLVECSRCSDKATVKIPSAPLLDFAGHAPPSTVSEQARAPVI